MIAIFLKKDSGIKPGTVQFNVFPVLRRVCGGGDLLDAFLMIMRYLEGYRKSSGRNEAAAAIPITAPADASIDRFECVVSAFEEHGSVKDQRTGRRWSDEGIRTIAADLVYLAEVQGRLGSELFTIEISGDIATRLDITIY